MSATTRLEKLSNKITDAMVDLVKRADGPVTLLEVEREVQGFATNTLRAWDFALPLVRGDCFVWGGMTEAGAAALGNVRYFV